MYKEPTYENPTLGRSLETLTLKEGIRARIHTSGVMYGIEIQRPNPAHPVHCLTNIKKSEYDDATVM